LHESILITRRAGIVDSLDELARFQWSGHVVLMSWIHQEWFERDCVLHFFGSMDVKARKAYLMFLEISSGDGEMIIGNN
jgi:hypothetical protein